MHTHTVLELLLFQYCVSTEARITCGTSSIVKKIHSFVNVSHQRKHIQPVWQDGRLVPVNLLFHSKILRNLGQVRVELDALTAFST